MTLKIMLESIIIYENGITTTNTKHKIVRDLVEELLNNRNQRYINTENLDSYYQGVLNTLIDLLDKLNNVN